MIRFSLAIGIAGIFASGGATLLLKGRPSLRSAHHFWAFGLGGLFPGWLVGFIALIQSAPGGAEAPLPPSALLSSAMALLGTIVTEFLVRWLDDRPSLRGPWTFWLLGLLALSPGWMIAVWLAG